jgi:PAS domain S-box-containing protein
MKEAPLSAKRKPRSPPEERDHASAERDHASAERVQSARDRDRLWCLSQELLVVCDYTGVITAANPAVARILGWDDPQFVGHNILDFLHPEDLGRSRAELGRMIDGLNMHAFENRVRTNRGDYRLIEWAGVPDDGRIHAIGRDVTAERAVMRDRERSWTLSPVLKVVATVDGTMMAVNPAWTRVLGWTEAECLGRHVSEFLAPEGREEGATSMAQLAQGRTMYEYPTTSMTKSGERRRIAWTTVPEGGLLYGFGRDVTEELRAAAALVASNTERERMWNTAYDLMGTIDPQGRLKSVNPAWSRLLGFLPEQLLDRSVLEFVPSDDVARYADVLRELNAGNAVHDFEHRLVHADGAVSLISWSAEPIGERVFYIVGRDVTEQRQSQEALRQSQKMEAIGQLSGGIAHDFNNLIQAIAGNLDILQQRLAGGEIADLERFIEGARRAASRAAGLTHRLLAFSRRQPLDPKPVNANPLVASMEDLLRRTLGEHIELEFKFCEEPWLILCDANQLESALLNLAINARDAMPDGGRLTIHTANRRSADYGPGPLQYMRPGEYLSIGVSDTGTGMSEDTVKRAFEPFFTTKPLGQGTGLGLSMVYGFSRQSGGYVHLDSQVGRGTTATLSLPRHLGTLPLRDAPRDAGTAASDPTGETILVVEDEPLVRCLIVELLVHLGYTVLEAGDGPSGLEILQSNRHVDLLVTDIGLPGLNGRQIADAARLPRPQLPVLFMTGYAENAAFSSGLDRGMSMIAKPFGMEALAAKVRAILKPAASDSRV